MLLGDDHDVNPVAKNELLPHLRDVRRDRHLANGERARDLRVAHATRGQAENLSFTNGKAVECRRHCLRRGGPSGAALDHPARDIRCE